MEYMPAMTQLSAGGRHSLALYQDGVLWVAGDNRNGQLGLPAEIESINAWQPDAFFQQYLLRRNLEILEQHKARPCDPVYGSNDSECEDDALLVL